MQTQGCVLSSWLLRSRGSLLVDRQEKHTPEAPLNTHPHTLSHPPHNSHLLKTMRPQAPPSEQCSHVCARFSSVLRALRGSSTRTHRAKQSHRCNAFSACFCLAYCNSTISKPNTNSPATSYTSFLHNM